MRCVIFSFVVEKFFVRARVRRRRRNVLDGVIDLVFSNNILVN